jgi:hypothetical protein
MARIAERRLVYMSLVGKREGKMQLGGPRRRWENNIKIYLKETECEGLDCIDLAPDGNLLKVLLSAVKNIRVP